MTIGLCPSREGIPMVMLWDTSTDEDIKVNEIIAKVIDVIDLEPVLPEVSQCITYSDISLTYSI